MGKWKFLNIQHDQKHRWNSLRGMIFIQTDIKKS